MGFLYRGGCFLPFLIIFNLFFGWLFLGFRLWLVVGLGLSLVFLIYSYLLSRKITSGINKPAAKSNVIDVEGEVLPDRKQKE
ncbi:MAG: hypothetical protein PHP89_04795 [Candidatus Omnitrophica bacterium]|jgi:hypothetical protein|nr:hypothetical protein [Candidatus Omnitrophota bacterium]MDD4981910.1 hypothetical protein [Candidatus Omnitrophota bacterium]MDD5665402.1 hypothetical protein [Candidatus Omnitrophota bacterium]